MVDTYAVLAVDIPDCSEYASWLLGSSTTRSLASGFDAIKAGRKNSAPPVLGFLSLDGIGGAVSTFLFLGGILAVVCLLHGPSCDVVICLVRRIRE